MTDLIADQTPDGWLVAGYFTPDYRHWAQGLAASLDSHGAPYHLFAVPKVAGGWEANTRAKPQAILTAMDRYPGKTLIWNDVDATVHGDLSPLAQIKADIAVRAGARRRGWRSGIKTVLNTGTLVIRPTPAARVLIESWADQSSKARRREHDQHTLLLAWPEAAGVTVTVLDPSWCGARAVIRHDVASRQHKSRFHRLRIDGIKSILSAKPGAAHPHHVPVWWRPAVDASPAQ